MRRLSSPGNNTRFASNVARELSLLPNRPVIFVESLAKLAPAVRALMMPAGRPWPNRIEFGPRWRSMPSIL